jgi:hypothetical protein
VIPEKRKRTIKSNERSEPTLNGEVFMRSDTLWTVTQLTEVMDSSWTAEDSRPQPDHNLLGQVIIGTSDLTTAAWITALGDVAVNHTDHSVHGDEISFAKGEQKKEIKWTIR